MTFSIENDVTWFYPVFFKWLWSQSPPSFFLYDSLFIYHGTTITQKRTLNNVDQMITIARRSPEKIWTVLQRVMSFSQKYSSLFLISRENFLLVNWSIYKKMGIPGSYYWEGRARLVTQLPVISTEERSLDCPSWGEALQENSSSLYLR